jgi:hypothetical protein
MEGDGQAEHGPSDVLGIRERRIWEGSKRMVSVSDRHAMFGSDTMGEMVKTGYDGEVLLNGRGHEARTCCKFGTKNCLRGWGLQVITCSPTRNGSRDDLRLSIARADTRHASWFLGIAC